MPVARVPPTFALLLTQFRSAQLIEWRREHLTKRQKLGLLVSRLKDTLVSSEVLIMTHIELSQAYRSMHVFNLV